MSIDIVLVSRERLSLTTIRKRFANPGVEAVLGNATIGGSPEEFPHITRVDTARLSVDFYGPQESRTGGGVAPYTTDLGIMAPTDDNGSTWWTQVDVVHGIDDEAAVEALLDVLGTLATAGGGHVVVQGAIADLPGVPPPTPTLAAPRPQKAPDPAVGRSYLGLFLPFRAPDAAGWDRVVRLVYALTEDVPDVWPGSIMVDGEWRRFEPTPQPPAWWPMAQEFSTAEPPTYWSLAPAGFPNQVLTRVLMNSAIGPATSERLLRVLLAQDVEYAFLHHWTQQEPLDGVAIGLRRGGKDSAPWVLLTEPDLSVALPGPYWLQVIGPAWEAVIGRDRLAATPAHRVEEIRPHHWLIQLTPTLNDVVTDWPGLAAACQQIRTHLGEELFWARHTGEHPRVTFGTPA